ncbi:exo-beta-N-acetylmuramidase NamZ family protein [Salicibibacter cibi]|nr:DUF1343 domain-containing protein [Salicibibacter cibi]
MFKRSWPSIPTSLFLIVLIGVLVGATTVLAEGGDGEQEEDSVQVKPGVEVFLDDHLDWIEGKRVGLATNMTGVDRDLNSTIDLLYEHPDVDLTALYGPEHGIRGNQEAGEYVESYTDERTGLPVYSLYGPTWEPTEEMLEDVDVLIYDIQDIGSNVYTYIYTLGFIMEAAAEHDKSVIVLDRPNAIGGEHVEGPVREQESVSFMGDFLLPVRHGMTAGELATMWKDEHDLNIDLKVAEMDGWERDMHFEDTGLPWVMTSPNIPTPDSATLYTGTILVANSTLSDGLGTTRPFELVGAPWIDAEELAEEMEQRDIEGVSFRPAYFDPMYDMYEGEIVGGVQVHIENESAIEVVQLGLELATAMRDQDPDKYELDDDYNELIGSKEAQEMLSDGAEAEDIIATWKGDLNTWIEDVRNQYLLYPPHPSDPISTEDIQGVVTDLEESGDIIDDDAVHDMQLHLRAVSQYENQEDGDTVIQHIGGFQDLLEHQLDNELISEEAYDDLHSQSEQLIEQWE